MRRCVTATCALNHPADTSMPAHLRLHRKQNRTVSLKVVTNMSQVVLSLCTVCLAP
jgi:hypothetical protein